MLWELLGTLIEGAIDLASDLFEDGGDPAAVAAPTDLAATAAPLDAAGSGGASTLAPMDGGISPDRFDPKPTFGAYAP